MPKIKSFLLKSSLLIFTLVITCILNAGICFAGEEYYNPETGYEVYIYDEADLLSNNEEEDLVEIMTPITEYGNVAFISVDENPYSTQKFAEDAYYQLFGTSSGTLFLIDMDNRNIWIQSDGAVYKRITTGYANTITDNIYTYATDEEYYECASRAYSQIYTLLRGGRIAQPMKYICNALLSLIFGFIITFFIVKRVSKKKAASDSDILGAIHTRCTITSPEVEFTHQSRHYSPKSSSRSGGGGRHGGHHGGGGGHGF